MNEKIKNKKLVKLYKFASREMFKDMNKRSQIFVSKKYKKPKYKHKITEEELFV